VLFHQLGQHLVLLLELGFQEGDALVAGLDLLVWPRPRPEGRRPILKELLQPAVAHKLC
jgi:hypothetical protein